VRGETVSKMRERKISTKTVWGRIKTVSGRREGKGKMGWESVKKEKKEKKSKKGNGLLEEKMAKTNCNLGSFKI